MIAKKLQLKTQKKKIVIEIIKGSITTKTQVFHIKFDLNPSKKL